MTMIAGLHNVLTSVFRKGVQCDVEILQQWLRMYDEIQKKGLPNVFHDCSSHFQNDIEQVFGEELESAVKADSAEIIDELNRMCDAGIIAKKEPYGEYAISDYTQCIFHGKIEDCFFAGHVIADNPLQLIRSRVNTFCLSHNVNRAQLDEIIISVTEAAENAVKYSDQGPIFCKQSIRDGTFVIKLLNSIPDLDLDNEIDRGKFSEDVSLMRGVLVMSKLLDDLNIERNAELGRVEFIGSKKIADRQTQK